MIARYIRHFYSLFKHIFLNYFFQGDSGGPLVVDGKLIGLVSFGRKVGGEKKTTVFTRVRNFLDFVEEVVPGF